MNNALLNLTYETCDAFKKQQEFQKLIELKELIQSDKEIIGLVDYFQSTKKRYEDAKAYGKYHPDLGRYQTLFQEAKIALMSNDIVKEYKSLERLLQKQLDRFSIALAESVSKNIKHPREMNVINLEES